MTSAGSAFKPYFRPDQLLVPLREPNPPKRVYSDPEPDVSSPAAENASSKHRRKRTTFTQHQATVLEKEYLSERYMVRDKRTLLAESLGLTEAQVKTWFQNRRAKDKREKKTDSPQRSPSESANVSVADDSPLETSQSSTISPSPSNEVAPTPPPRLKPATSPVVQSHQILSGLLQAHPVPEYSQYFSNLGLPPIETVPSYMSNQMRKSDAYSSETAVKDIYKMHSNIYEQNFGSMYAHVPLSLNPLNSTLSPGYIPEPLAPVANNDTLAVEHTQLTAL